MLKKRPYELKEPNQLKAGDLFRFPNRPNWYRVKEFRKNKLVYYDPNGTKYILETAFFIGFLKVFSQLTFK